MSLHPVLVCCFRQPRSRGLMKWLGVLRAEALSMCSIMTEFLKLLKQVLGFMQTTSEYVAV